MLAKAAIEVIDSRRSGLQGEDVGMRQIKTGRIDIACRLLIIGRLRIETDQCRKITGGVGRKQCLIKRVTVHDATPQTGGRR